MERAAVGGTSLRFFITSMLAIALLSSCDPASSASASGGKCGQNVEGAWLPKKLSPTGGGARASVTGTGTGCAPVLVSSLLTSPTIISLFMTFTPKLPKGLGTKRATQTWSLTWTGVITPAACHVVSTASFTPGVGEPALTLTTSPYRIDV